MLSRERKGRQQPKPFRAKINKKIAESAKISGSLKDKFNELSTAVENMVRDMPDEKAREVTGYVRFIPGIRCHIRSGNIRLILLSVVIFPRLPKYDNG